jgi:hypothetical protein
MTMNTTRLRRWAVTAALAASLGACVGYVEGGGGYVEAGAAFPERVYYYDPIWPGFVFFSEGPDVVVKREVFVERDGRRYHMDGGRRVYYDHSRALGNRAPRR